MRARWLVAIVVVVTATVSCWDTTYNCTRDDQCVLHGVAGHCEAKGLCSFPADQLPERSHLRDHFAGRRHLRAASRQQ